MLNKETTENFDLLSKMANDSKLKEELQALVSSSGSHKDTTEKFKAIFNKIVSLDKHDLAPSLKVFIESGQLEDFDTG